MILVVQLGMQWADQMGKEDQEDQMDQADQADQEVQMDQADKISACSAIFSTIDGLNLNNKRG